MYLWSLLFVLQLNQVLTQGNPRGEPGNHLRQTVLDDTRRTRPSANTRVYRPDNTMERSDSFDDNYHTTQIRDGQRFYYEVGNGPDGYANYYLDYVNSHHEAQPENNNHNTRGHPSGNRNRRPLKNGTWTPLVNQPTFESFPNIGAPAFEGGANAPKLLTDGSVLVQNVGYWVTSEIWKLTPDQYGSYVNGTWSQLASLPDGYSPYGYGSAVLADGRVVFMGGEYNGFEFDAVWTSLAAIYDPIADDWTPINPPDFFSGAGDCSTVVLEDGTLMVQDALTDKSALLDAKTLTWKETGFDKLDRNDEEGWVLLPNGKVLTVDASGIPIIEVTITTNQKGIGPFQGITSIASLTKKIAPPSPATGGIPSPDPTACTGNLTDLYGKIAVYERTCSSVVSLNNIESAGAIAAIQISQVGPVIQVAGAFSANIYLCSVSVRDGATLQYAIDLYPDMEITISQPPVPDVVSNNSEIYDPKTGKWSSAGNTVVSISDRDFEEQGPLILRPDGTVVAFGSTYGHTAIYDTHTGKWRAGPDFPIDPVNGQLGMADGSAALLPNGNILVSAQAGYYQYPQTYIFEFDGHQFFPQPVFPLGNSEPGANPQLMLLPTGQVMMVDQTNDVEIYTPGDNSFNHEWRPVIYHYPKEVKPSHTYKIEGIRFNGMSQASLYGDNYQGATNYPLVRITNKKTKHVFYCRTHDHSFMGVASSKIVSTYFDVGKVEEGESILEVVANGIPSEPLHIKVVSRKEQKSHYYPKKPEVRI